MTLGWPWLILRQVQIWSHRLFCRKKWKLLIFQNICSLSPGTNWKKWTYVSIEGQCHFLTLAQGHLHTKLKTCLSQKPLGQSKPNFICKLSGTRKWKFDDMMLVTWPRWLPRPYMVKTLQKSSSLELADGFPWNLLCSIGDSSPL